MNFATMMIHQNRVRSCSFDVLQDARFSQKKAASERRLPDRFGFLLDQNTAAGFAFHNPFARVDLT